MSYATQALHSAEAAERRGGPRRICRVRATVTVAGQRLAGTTIDLGNEGVAVLLPCPLPNGTNCEISFSIFARGAVQRLDLGVQAAHSVFLSHNVRVGFTFTRIGIEQRKLLSDFVTYGSGR